MYGINLYAERAGTIVTTVDCDLLIPADVSILARILGILGHLRYDFEAGREPLVDHSSSNLSGIVQARANVTAHRKGVQIDLPMEIAGYDFDSLWKRHRRFRVRGGMFRVAPLADMVRSKQLADRPKDRMFLEVYRDALAPLLAADKKPKPRKKR